MVSEDFLNLILKDSPELKPVLRWLYIILFSFVAMWLVCLIASNIPKHKTTKFVPIAGIVKSAYTETQMYAGTHYQRIIIKGKKKKITANGFEAELNGEKVRLIDFVEVGDSVIWKSFDTLFVYKNGCGACKFIWHKY